MKVTVDINVLLDVFQKREPHYAASARVLAVVQQGEVDGVFPAHGFTTLYYLVRCPRPQNRESLLRALCFLLFKIFLPAGLWC